MELKPLVPPTIFVSQLIDAHIKDVYEHQKVKLDTYEHFRNKMRSAVLKNFEEYTQNLEEGFNHILHSSHFTKKEQKEIEEKLEKADFTNTLNREKFYEAGTLGAYIGLEHSFYQKALERGKELINEGKNKEAEKAFMVLTHLDPTIHQYHYGLGVALISQGRPIEALTAFAIALDFAGNDAFTILLWISDCLVMMNELQATEELLTYILKETEGKEEFKTNREVAQKKSEILNKMR